jgi:hypothetical protein
VEVVRKAIPEIRGSLRYFGVKVTSLESPYVVKNGVMVRLTCCKSRRENCPFRISMKVGSESILTQVFTVPSHTHPT